MTTKPTFNLKPILRMNAPEVYRIAIALCGDGATASRITRRVLQKAVGQMHTWETDQDVIRWFARFTILNTRGCGVPDPKRDELLKLASDPETAALIQAMRQLPMQQREAFVLHHGQGMELRQMATAMDCSASAAATHLTAAVQALRALYPGGLSSFTSDLPRLIGLLAPPPERVEIQIRQVIRRKRIRAVVRYGLVWPIGLLVLIAAVWEGYRIWKMIEI